MGKKKWSCVDLVSWRKSLNSCWLVTGCFQRSWISGLHCMFGGISIPRGLSFRKRQSKNMLTEKVYSKHVSGSCWWRSTVIILEDCSVSGHDELLSYHCSSPDPDFTSKKHRPGSCSWQLGQRTESWEMLNLVQLFLRHRGFTRYIQGTEPPAGCSLGQIWRASPGSGPTFSSWAPFPDPADNSTLLVSLWVNVEKLARGKSH